MNKKKAYMITLWVLLAASILVLFQLAPTLTNPQQYSTDDFFPYWAAGKLILSGENPYDAEEKNDLQIAVSGQGSTAYPISIMLNPPWAVSLVIPFGMIRYTISRLAWMILSISGIVFSAQLFWRYYNGPPQQRWIAWLAIILFAPIISVLEVGQISALILLGISLFIYFMISRQNDWAAGAALVLVSIKPQVTYLFWLALLFWVIQQKRWKILAGCTLTLAGLTLAAAAFNPRIIQQYLAMAQTGYLPELATPTLGAYLRFFWLGTDKFWLQFVAPVMGAAWFIFYWIKHAKDWSWLNELPILLLVSLLTAPYTYTYDQVILVPAIIQAFTWLQRDWKQWRTLALFAVFLVINLLDLFLHMRFSDFWFVWMAPALLAWYLLARRHSMESKSKVTAPSPIMEQTHGTTK